ncbi:MAG: sugar phosphate isomerase/epimerase [Clostridia bacterium]|nr:sugar phosphate isomerase/epimerase [Clostridia bacterium]
MKQLPVGYQMYSAREKAQKDLKGVCRALKAMGYDGVEFAGFYGHSAEEIKAILDETGLRAVSNHAPASAFERDVFGLLSFHQAIGCKYIAIPSLDRQQRPGGPRFAETLRKMNRWGRLCKEAGIQLLYHNHDFEFVPVSGMYGLDFLFAATEPDLLQTEIDVCWVKYAGVDPADYVRKYAGRAPLVHMKDFVGQKGDGTPYALIGQTAQADEGVAFEYRPLGHGCQDMRAVTDAALDAGAEWLIVEQDDWYGRDPMELAKESMDTLYDLGVKTR